MSPTKDNKGGFPSNVLLLLSLRFEANHTSETQLIDGVTSVIIYINNNIMSNCMLFFEWVQIKSKSNAIY